MIEKNEFPILEHDSEKTATIRPERYGFHFPEKLVFAFLGDEVDDYAKAHQAEVLEVYETVTSKFPIYKLTVENQEITIVRAPVGSAPAGQILDFLIGAGVKKIVAIGSCGSLIDLPENKWIIPTKALRDEGTSYHYLPASRTIDLQKSVVTSLENSFKKLGLETERCMTWTTDAFYRETPDMIAYRVSEGCQVVEMECSALAAIAEFRGVAFGQILYTADSLANSSQYDDRGWGENAREIAMELALKAVLEL